MFCHVINSHNAVAADLTKTLEKKESIDEIIFFGHRQEDATDTIAIGFTVKFTNHIAPEIYYNNTLSLGAMNRIRETFSFINKLYSAGYKLYFNKYIFFYQDFLSKPAELYKVLNNKTKYPFSEYMEFFDLLYPNWDAMEVHVPWEL